MPGCSFQKGETTYKIAAIPLGGYVQMVGEGAEAEESEDYPRSFKNKSVGQRMSSKPNWILLMCSCSPTVLR